METATHEIEEQRFASVIFAESHNAIRRSRQFAMFRGFDLLWLRIGRRLKRPDAAGVEIGIQIVSLQFRQLRRDTLARR